MTVWTRSSDIRQRLEKKWHRGELLAQCVTPGPFEPLRIPLKHPTARQLTHEFDAARTWVKHLVDHAGKQDNTRFAIEWQTVNHRTLGKNRMPRAIIFHTLEAILAYLGKTAAAKQYQYLFKKIATPLPELASLLTEKPLDVLAHATVWNELLAIVLFLKQTPGPGIYLRQLEIPGVDTKFIETHKAWLTRLLTRVLPRDAINEQARGPASFEHRFGFLSKPSRIRFRTLDPDFTLMGLSDLEIPEQDFSHLPIMPETIFIVENDINGLAFPFFPRAIVIFGLGYGLSTLSKARWITDRPVWYWGDIDTHGFAMLDQVRHHFPQTRSFLMNHATLLSHKPLWGRETAPVNRDLPLLTADEAGVYDLLRNNTLAPRLRLEQERISFAQVRGVVAAIGKNG